MSIADFYSGKCVLITGATGFIGKMIVEKLLRSCPEVDKIFLLARAKKNKTASERVQDITNVPLFDVIREKNAESFKKICLIEGDIAKENLGLSEADQELFCDKINIIIHSAATLSFTEPLKIAVATNLQSVKEIMKLGRKTKNLEAFIHVSTAYTNWFKKDVKEIFYEPKYDPNKVLEMCRTLSDEELSKKISSISPHLLTYTFSKSLAEYLIKLEGFDFPVAIVRPSIVTGSFKEPFPGWIETFSGASVLGFMIAKGVLRNLHMKKDFICDIIPADFVVNTILSAAWKVGTDQNSRNSMPIIYNCSSSTIKPITNKDLFKGFEENGRKFPHSDVIWYPKINFHNTALTAKIAVFLSQKLPSHLIDFGLKAMGQKEKMIRTQNYIYNYYVDAKFATTNSIIFQSENFVKLGRERSETDLKEFDFDVRKIDWKKYFETYHLGLRHYMGKDHSENYDELRRKIERLKFEEFILNGTLLAGSVYLLSKL
ncbi:hypothetical protein PVAND_015431 [Polypedilum vanderplanki]|uniref:Fatty acyl-CoA reductase n=1 Tax=Polypedilum vanderplanki TaxID=319348 RepID=A0A9J6BD40_POLVA|nr:hypothetical protein PVAND_015431 [Polypedilum vanderplanki]